MAYFDRLHQLELTLKTITMSKYQGPIEIIIVDDCSTHEMGAINLLHRLNVRGGIDSNIVIKIYTVNSSLRNWINPCIPYNIAIGKCTGDVVILQNPECMHIGDITSKSVELVDDESYITFSVFAVVDEQVEVMDKIKQIPMDESFCDSVKKALNIKSVKNSSVVGVNHWYNHPLYNPRYLHFTSAITLENLKKLGGFDEKYAQGLGWDDTEILIRIQRMGLKILALPPDNVFSIHQPHSFTTKIRRPITKLLLKVNERLFENVTFVNCDLVTNEKR